MNPTTLPRLISVIAPCRNEAAFIDTFCDSVLRQQLPEGWHMEVLIADGLSDDGTRELLQERCARDGRLVLVSGQEIHRAEGQHWTLWVQV